MTKVKKKEVIKSKLKKTSTKKPPIKATNVSPQQLEKQKATAANEPWVGILRMDIDPENISDGAFELDWNETFIARLVKAGYQGKTDQDLVDQWFQTVCENVVSGNYEQMVADPEVRRVIQKVQLDKERTEHS